MNSKYSLALMHILAGVIYALNFPFIGELTIFPTIFISSAILFYGLFKEKRLKYLLLNAFLFSWGYNFAGYYWLTFTLNQFGGLFFPFNFLLWQLFSIIIAPHFYIFVILFFFINKRLDIRSSYGGIVLSLLFVLLEYFVPQQFPALFGHPWLKVSPYLKPARYLGVPFYSFLSLFIGYAIFKASIYKKLPKVESIIIATALIFNFSMGAIENDSKLDLNLRVVQGNIGNDLKLKSEQGIKLAASQVVQTYVDMSLRDSANELDLIIWPETSYPRYIYTKKSKYLSQELSTLWNSNSKYFFGTYDLATNNPKVLENVYNASILTEKTGEISQIYHKQELIPFGEGLPLGPLNKYIAPYLTNISFFAKGEKFTSFRIKDKTFISLICYEVLFPRYVKKYFNALEKKPDFIINLTNDSWYGRYSEQEQHLFLAKWRSVEFNVPMVRATNTGITSVILQDGTELKRTKNFEQINLDFSL